MSVVSNAVIHMDLDFGSNSAIHTAIREKIFTSGRGVEQSFELIDLSGAGGSKDFESDVYAGAFNYVPSSEIVEWFKSLPWRDYDTATLTIDGNDFWVLCARFNDKWIEAES